MNFSDILSLFRQGKGTARSHMKNLIEIAVADGIFDLVEHNLLNKIAIRNNIDEEQLKAIHDNPSKVDFILPEDKQEKFNQFYDLIHMMSIDKSIHPDEMALCNIFAAKFGYSPDYVDEIIDTIQVHILNKQPQEEAFKSVEWMLG